MALESEVRLPRGFSAGALASGIKPSGKLDLALLYSEREANWAYAATSNRAAAPCVLRGRRLYDAGSGLRGLIVNSGNANCATGVRGVKDDLRMAELAARFLQIEADSLLTASTGVIGVPLAIEKIEKALPGMQMSSSAGSFARAILTTDTRPKVAARELSGGARIVGVAKGSGMIHPNMATMLAYILSDAEVPRSEMVKKWPLIVDATFNQTTVDGDTSTNDMAVLVSNGVAGSVDAQEFWRTVEDVATDLARQIARDGEGAEKLITVHVSGARELREARQAARTIAGSTLWKAAVHGNDPNWGRILAALGRSGARFDPERARIKLQGSLIYDGGAVPFNGVEVQAAMQAAEVVVEVELANGEATASAWGCDLTEAYVKINAEYTT